MASALIFVLGLLVGSFLNVVILRYNTGRPLAAGRSQCPACGGALRWFELIPVVSFLAQLGRCRRCRSRISWQYPLVELLTATLFLLISGLSLSPLATLLQLAIWSLLLVIVVYDLRHLIIPDGPLYLFLVLTFLSLWLRGFPLADFALGLGAAAVFWLLWRLSGGRWLGFGDSKLVLGLGWLGGWPAGLSGLILAFWLGAAIGIGLMILSRLSPRAKSFTMKSELPFAPFLVLGLALATLFSLNVFPL